MAVFRGRVAVHRDERGRRALRAASLPLMLVALAGAAAGGALRTGLPIAFSGPLMLVAAVTALLAGRERALVPEEMEGTVAIDDETVAIEAAAGTTRIARGRVA